MYQYDYFWEMKHDVGKWIDTHSERPQQGENLADFKQRLWDALNQDESCSGVICVNAKKSLECLSCNFDLLGGVLEEYPSCAEIVKLGPQACDMAIRRYLLEDVISEVVDEKSEEDH